MPVEDDDLYDDEHDGDEEDGPRTNSDFAALRKANKARKQAEAKAAAYERTLAFVRAGIDPEAQGMAAYFVKGYDGDLTPEKIREAAVSAGVLAPPAPDPAEQEAAQRQQAALEAQQRIAGAATAGMAAPSAGEEDQIALAEAMRQGGIEALTATLAAQGIPVEEF